MDKSGLIVAAVVWKIAKRQTEEITVEGIIPSLVCRVVKGTLTEGSKDGETGLELWRAHTNAQGKEGSVWKGGGDPHGVLHNLPHWAGTFESRCHVLQLHGFVDALQKLSAWRLRK